MIKDRYQKEKMLQYFLTRGWYPQLEVDIYYSEGPSSKPKAITDIDVLAMSTTPDGTFSPIIGDCKTLKNQSPINRAFWIKGLMSYMNANSGIILLSKSIESEHKLLSNSMNVHLLSDEDFKVFASATATAEPETKPALSDIENWDRYFLIPNTFPALLPLFKYCKSDFWNEREANIRLRHSIAKLQGVRHELNPSNDINMFLFLELCSLFAIALNEICISTFNKYLWPKDKSSLDTELKVLLWGGYENYQFLNQLRTKLITKQSAEPTEPTEQLSLPEWPTFVQLVRACLDSPMDTSIVPLIIKELAFQYLIQQVSISNPKEYLGKMLKSHPQSSKFAVLIIEYLTKAARLPRDFSDYATSQIMKLQRIQ